ncbi:ionotropic receptor 21a-like [Centruroides vittatus]|uniref:ionotropic receptor 21a-like n=1 Tax=Centruroides vittatus TaxID=120091 RepID=UPI00350FE949
MSAKESKKSVTLMPPVSPENTGSREMIPLNPPDVRGFGFEFRLDFTLVAEEADIAIHGGNIRKIYRSYTSSVTHISTTFAIPAARSLDKAVSLVKPFDLMIWICIPVSFCIMLLTLYRIMKKETEYSSKEIPNFSTLFWTIFRTFLRQDTDVDRYFLMTFRILIGCWLLITFVLTSAYLGTLPSFMVNPGSEVIPQTFIELARSVKAGRYNITFFRHSHECLYFDRCFNNRILKKTIIQNDVIEIFDENVQKYNEPGKEPIEKLLNGNYALLASRQQIELSMTEEEKQNVFVSEDILFTKFKFIQINLVKVNYAVELANTVNRIAQSGLTEKIQRDMRNTRQRRDLFYNDNTIHTDEDKPLEIDDITGILYLLVTGYLISSVAFLAEILVNKIKVFTRQK